MAVDLSDETETVLEQPDIDAMKFLPFNANADA